MPEYPEGWGAVEFTRKLDLDSLRITTPEGFKIDLFIKGDLINLLMALVLDEGMLQFGGSRFKLGPHGVIILVDTDAWENREFNYGKIVCSKRELAGVVGKYLLGKQR